MGTMSLFSTGSETSPLADEITEDRPHRDADEHAHQEIMLLQRVAGFHRHGIHRSFLLKASGARGGPERRAPRPPAASLHRKFYTFPRDLPSDAFRFAGDHFAAGSAAAATWDVGGASAAAMAVNAVDRAARSASDLLSEV